MASSLHSTSDMQSLRDTGLILVKIWCLILVFFGTFLGGISPYFYRWNNAFLVLGTQFAGGVFLGTAFIHFLPDSNSTFQERTDKDYPFAFTLAAAGYLLTMSGDSVIQWIFTREVAAGRVDIEEGKAKPVRSAGSDGLNGEVGKVDVPSATAKSRSAEKQCCGEEDSSNAELGIGAQNGPARNSLGEKCSCCGESLKACTCAEQLAEPVGVRNIVKATLVQSASLGDSVLLIVALCFHSVFEGIAIGVAETKGDAWKALWTVSLHKIFAAIAMGIALLRMLPNRPFISCAAYSFFFAISSPIGITIGIIIDATTQGPFADWTFAISMGLASGVFVFVAINHLLAKGYVPPCQVAVDTPFYKFLAVLIGVSVIAVVMIWDT